jgi:serine/threonine protein kinase
MIPPNPAAKPITTPIVLGRYRVEVRLGDNRLATVYHATDERLRRTVLLHLLRKDLLGQERIRARFVAEATESARRSHPALLEIFDSGESGDRPFMVTEYIAGRPLRELGTLSPEHALLYLRQVSGAVAMCQSHRSPAQPVGLLHPPISSSNVLLVDDGRVKLVESWLLLPAEVPADLAHYRAPERGSGGLPTTTTAVYALGILLFELLSGTRPSDPGAPLPSLAQIRPQLYLPALDQLISKATARFPEHRYVDAQQLAVALDTLWRELGSSTQQLSPAELPRSRRKPPGNTLAPIPTAQPQPTGTNAAPGPTASPSLQPLSQAQVKHQRKAGGLRGWIVMLALIGLVALASYAGVRYVSDRIAITLPGIPGLPAIDPFAWLRDRLGGAELWVVNNEGGLNLRSTPGLSSDSMVIAVVPNGTVVRQLEGPLIVENISWIRVRVDVDGRATEGWMSLNYLARPGN